MQILIRKAARQDVEHIVASSRNFETFQKRLLKNDDCYQALLAKSKGYEKLYTKKVLKRIKSRNALVLIAESKGKVVGFSSNQILKSAPIYRLKCIGYIEEIYVEPGYRGKGVGSALKEAAFTWFMNKGVKYIRIGLNKQNSKAHAAYEKWGFRDFSLHMMAKIHA